MVGRSSMRVVVVVVAILRAAAALIHGPLITEDSYRYALASTWLDTLQPWKGFGPGVLVQVLAVLPLPAMVAVQALMCGLLWGWASLLAAERAVGGPSKLAFASVIALSLSPWVLFWDSNVLTEALSIAALALVCVAAVRLCTTPDAMLPLLVGVVVAGLTRPYVATLVVPIALVGLAISHRLKVAPLLLVTFVLCFAGLQLWAFSSSGPVSEQISMVQAKNRFGSRFHVAGYLEAARSHGMPECAAATSHPQDPAAVRAFRRDPLTLCPSLKPWLGKGGLPWLEELRLLPGPLVVEAVRPDYWSWSPLGTYVIDDPSAGPVWRWIGTDWRLAAINRSTVGFLLAVTGAGLALSRGPERCVVATVVLLSVAVGGHAWLIDGAEYWRHTLPALLPPAIVGAALLARRYGSTPPMRATS
jgi:FtsH-binding integral membrane protein